MSMSPARWLEGGWRRYEFVPWRVMRPGFWPRSLVTCAESYLLVKLRTCYSPW